MIRVAAPILATLVASLLCQCMTTEQVATTKTAPIVVSGTLFYPDDASKTYIIPSGAEIIGAGGANCRFVVEAGGRMTAHSGQNNVYQIKKGGAFKGFDHPATNCKVNYHPGANVEALQTGKGVSFNVTN